jgi:hypothetical protein
MPDTEALAIAQRAGRLTLNGCGLIPIAQIDRLLAGADE